MGVRVTGWSDGYVRVHGRPGGCENGMLDGWEGAGVVFAVRGKQRVVMLLAVL